MLPGWIRGDNNKAIFVSNFGGDPDANGRDDTVVTWLVTMRHSWVSSTARSHLPVVGLLLALVGRVPGPGGFEQVVPRIQPHAKYAGCARAQQEREAFGDWTIKPDVCAHG